MVRAGRTPDPRLRHGTLSRPPHLLEVSWREDGWDYTTTVHLMLRQVGDGTQITIVHKDWPSPVTNGVRTSLAKHYYGWKSCLNRLKRYATTMNHATS